MTKNNDGRLDHCDPIPDFIKSGKYRVFNFIFLFFIILTARVLKRLLLPVLSQRLVFIAEYCEICSVEVYRKFIG